MRQDQITLIQDIPVDYHQELVETRTALLKSNDLCKDLKEELDYKRDRRKEKKAMHEQELANMQIQHQMIVENIENQHQLVITNIENVYQVQITNIQAANQIVIATMEAEQATRNAENADQEAFMQSTVEMLQQILNEHKEFINEKDKELAEARRIHSEDLTRVDNLEEEKTLLMNTIRDMFEAYQRNCAQKDERIVNLIEAHNSNTNRIKDLIATHNAQMEEIREWGMLWQEEREKVISLIKEEIITQVKNTIADNCDLRISSAQRLLEHLNNARINVKYMLGCEYETTTSLHDQISGNIDTALERSIFSILQTHDLSPKAQEILQGMVMHIEQAQDLGNARNMQ